MINRYMCEDWSYSPLIVYIVIDLTKAHPVEVDLRKVVVGVCVRMCVCVCVCVCTCVQKY